MNFQVRKGEIVCITGIDGNGQTELVYGLSGLEPLKSGSIAMNGKDITNAPIRQRSVMGCHEWKRHHQCLYPSAVCDRYEPYP